MVVQDQAMDENQFGVKRSAFEELLANYSDKRIQKFFTDHYDWNNFESLADITAKLDSLKKLWIRRDEFKTVIWDEKYSPFVRRLVIDEDIIPLVRGVSTDAWNWKELDGQHFEEFFSKENLESWKIRKKLDRLQELVDKRSQLRELLWENVAEESRYLGRRVWEMEPQDVPPTYSQEVRRVYAEKYNWREKSKENLEDFFTSFNLQKTRKELNRIQNLVNKKSNLKDLLAEYSETPKVRKMYTEKNNWKGRSLEELENFFTTFKYKEARMELDQIEESVQTLKQAKDWKKGYRERFPKHSQKNLNMLDFFLGESDERRKIFFHLIQSKPREIMEMPKEDRESKGLTDQRIKHIFAIFDKWQECVGGGEWWNVKMSEKLPELDLSQKYFGNLKELSTCAKNVEDYLSVLDAKKWKKSVMDEYNTLDDKTVQLLQKAGKQDILDQLDDAINTKIHKAAKMSEVARDKISANLGALISEVDEALEVWNGCLQEQGLNQDWNLEDLLPEDSKFSVCLEEFANVL